LQLIIVFTASGGGGGGGGYTEDFEVVVVGGGGGGGGATRVFSSFLGSTLIVNAIAEVLSNINDMAQVSISLFIKDLIRLWLLQQK
jgi:hypothetical protein